MASLKQRLREKEEEVGDLQANLASLQRGEAYLDMSLPLHDTSGSGDMLNISMTGRVRKYRHDCVLLRLFFLDLHTET